MLDKTEVATSVKWATIGTVSQALFGVLKLSVLTRFLDREDFGLMAILIMIIGFVDLFSDMGLSSAIMHKQVISKKEYASLYWLNIMISIVLYLIVLTITPIISRFYNLPSLENFIPMLASNVVISSLGRQFKTLDNKNMLFKEVAIVDLIAAAISLFLSIILAIYNFGILALIYSTIVQYLFSNLLFLILGMRRYGLLFHYKFDETKQFLSIGIYQVGGQIINFFNRDLDIIIIGKIFPPDVLGSYNLAKQLVFRPTQIINPVLTKVATPMLAKIQNNLLELKEVYLKIVNIVAYVNIFIYSTIILTAPWIIRLLYGSGYENISTLVRTLCFYMVIRAIGNPIGSLTTATGKTKLEFYWNALTLIVIPIFLLTGSAYGIIGVSNSLTLANIILFVPFWRVLVKPLTGASLKEYIKAILDISFIKISFNKNLILITKKLYLKK